MYWVVWRKQIFREEENIANFTSHADTLAGKRCLFRRFKVDGKKHNVATEVLLETFNLLRSIHRLIGFLPVGASPTVFPRQKSVFDHLLRLRGVLFWEKPSV